MNEHDPLTSLRSVATEERMARLWRGVRDRRHAPAGPPWRAVLWPTAALAAAALLLLLLRPMAPGPGPLRRTDVAASSVPSTLATGSRRERVTFDDGSALRLEPDTLIEVDRNTRDRVSLTLARGAAYFSVQPGGPRRWRVRTAHATVEVVGTRFWVDARRGRTQVRVDRGRVHVEAEGATHVLVRGERLTVEPTARAATEVEDRTPASGSPVRRPAAPDESDPQTVAARPGRPPTTSAPAASSSRGDAPMAPMPPPPPEPRAPSEGETNLATDEPGADMESWLQAADRAREEGRPQDAVRWLERAARQDHPDAAVAAYTLGRIEMDELRHPSRARAAFTRALELGLAAPLAARARRRLESLGSSP